jgi:hypothetical protein
MVDERSHNDVFRTRVPGFELRLLESTKMSAKASVRTQVGRTVIVWGPACPIAANDERGSDHLYWQVAAARQASAARHSLPLEQKRRIASGVPFLRVVGE